jgi:hypothetical protein
VYDNVPKNGPQLLRLQGIAPHQPTRRDDFPVYWPSFRNRGQVSALARGRANVAGRVGGTYQVIAETLEVRVSTPPGSTFSGEERRQKMRFDQRGHWPQYYFGP